MLGGLLRLLFADVHVINLLGQGARVIAGFKKSKVVGEISRQTILLFGLQSSPVQA